MQNRRFDISEVELTNAGASAELDAGLCIKPRYSLYQQLIGFATLALLVILVCVEAPRMMKDSLDICVAQYAADHKISAQAFSTDMTYQPEYTEALSLCAAPNL